MSNEKEILFNHINYLFKNENNTNISYLKNKYSKKDYYKLLKNIMTIIKTNQNIENIKNDILQASNLENIIKDYVLKTKTTPGMVLDFGTQNIRDTFICGNSQEVSLINNKLIKDEQPIKEDSIFDLASTSKFFTTISILKLAEDNLLNLYKPIYEYDNRFINLNNVTVFDLLKFNVNVVTDKRIDTASNTKEAENILFNAHKSELTNKLNAYTDIGSMILKYVVESIAKISFNEYLSENFLKPLMMTDTHLVVPQEKISRVVNENYSSIILSDGKDLTKYENFPGTQHDNKALAIGALKNNAPGHAGYFSTKDDLLKLANAILNFKILNQDSIFSISNNFVGEKIDNTYTKHFGSLVYIKQPNPEYLSVYQPLSGKSFMSPGFAGTTLCIDPINKITLFVGANRLHNRIYQIHKNQEQFIKTNEYNQKTYILQNNETKIISKDFALEKEKIVHTALDLALQYQFLEKLFKDEKKMHLVKVLK